MTSLVPIKPNLALAQIEAPVIDALRKLCVDAEGKPASENEVMAFAQYCAKKGLDPFSKHAYFIKDKRGKVSYQISIDGLRGRAEATGRYRGRLGPYWMGKDKEWRDYWAEDGAPLAARVGVLREGWSEPCWGFARFKSFCGIVQDYTPWGKAPDNQLAKCAEAQALRAAFPEVCGGLYLSEDYTAGVESVDGEIIPEPETPAPAPAKKFKHVDVSKPVETTPPKRGKAEAAPEPAKPASEKTPSQASIEFTENTDESMLKCEQCGQTTSPVLTKSGPHTRADCGYCGRYIKFVGKNTTDKTHQQMVEQAKEVFPGAQDVTPQVDAFGDNEPASEELKSDVWIRWCERFGKANAKAEMQRLLPEITSMRAATVGQVAKIETVLAAHSDATEKEFDLF